MRIPSRYTYISVLGYGDALISLQLLQRTAPWDAPIRIAGTAITRDVQAGIVGSNFPLIEVVPDHAAFFRVRQAGLRHSIRDLLAIRRWAASALGPDDLVLFEKPDFRNRLALGSCKARVVAPTRAVSSYADRQRMLEQITGRHIELLDCARPTRPPRSVLINPSARAVEREIPPVLMRRLVELFHARGVRVSVTDPEGKYAGARAQFDQYHGRLGLSEAAKLMREHELYFGPDSFFIHLAYFLGVPFFTLVPTIDFNFYFAPPGSMQLGNFIALPHTNDRARLAQALDRFAGW